jgi:osmotically-inducible protein OsmY
MREQALELIESTPVRHPTPADGSARDAYIAGRLVTAYALNEQLSPYDLRVDVQAGVVTLSGIVDDRVLRDLAADIARDIDEVAEVRCELAVESPAPHRADGSDGFARRFHDASLAAQVKSRLLWNGDTHGAQIDVTASDGVVTLTGKVSSPRVGEVAEQLAAQLRRVKRVENLLRVAAG